MIGRHPHGGGGRHGDPATLFDEEVRVQVLRRHVLRRAKTAGRGAAERFGPAGRHGTPAFKIDWQRRVTDGASGFPAVPLVQQMIRIGQCPVPRADADIVPFVRSGRLAPPEIDARPSGGIEQIGLVDWGAEQLIVFDVQEPCRQSVDAVQVRDDGERIERGEVRRRHEHVVVDESELGRVDPRGRLRAAGDHVHLPHPRHMLRERSQTVFEDLQIVAIAVRIQIVFIERLCLESILISGPGAVDPRVDGIYRSHATMPRTLSCRSSMMLRRVLYGRAVPLSPRRGVVNAGPYR